MSQLTVHRLPEWLAALRPNDKLAPTLGQDPALIFNVSHSGGLLLYGVCGRSILPLVTWAPRLPKAMIGR